MEEGIRLQAVIGFLLVCVPAAALVGLLALLARRLLSTPRTETVGRALSIALGVGGAVGVAFTVWIASGGYSHAWAERLFVSASAPLLWLPWLPFSQDGTALLAVAPFFIAIEVAVPLCLAIILVSSIRAAVAIRRGITDASPHQQ